MKKLLFILLFIPTLIFSQNKWTFSFGGGIASSLPKSKIIKIETISKVVGSGTKEYNDVTLKKGLTKSYGVFINLRCIIILHQN